VTSNRDTDNPWFPFFVQDYMADEAVKSVSLAAQGLWVRMLCLMHRSPRRGILLKPSGEQPDSKWLASQIGASEPEVAELLKELESEKVFSRNENGSIYNRRMRKEALVSERKAKAGRLGGLAKAKQKNTPLFDEFSDSKSLAASGSGSGYGCGCSSKEDVVKEEEEEEKKEETGPQSKTKAKGKQNETEKEIIILYQQRVKSTVQGDTSGPQARKNVARLIREGQTPADLRQAVLNYADFCTILGKEPQFRKNAGNFFGREAVYEGFLPQAYKKPQQPGGGEKPWRNFDIDGPRPIPPPAYLDEVTGGPLPDWLKELRAGTKKEEAKS
jgi:hypothetical protein